jgi:cell division protein ZapA
MNKIKIEICGAPYVISTAENPDYVRSLGAEIDKQVKQHMAEGAKVSLNGALVLTALNYADAYKKSEQSADHMRAQLADYLEDATRARMELDEARREIGRLGKLLDAYGYRQEPKR